VRNDPDVSSGLARTALSNRIWTGISRGRLARLIGDLAVPWAAAEEDRLLTRREHERLRAAGAGPDHGLPFTDRVIVTLVYLRFQLPHATLAELYRVHRSTVTRAVGEVDFNGLLTQPSSLQRDVGKIVIDPGSGLLTASEANGSARVVSLVAGPGGARFVMAKVIMMLSLGRGWSWATAVTA
jgi:DDE superfamily endonuclease